MYKLKDSIVFEDSFFFKRRRSVGVCFFFYPDGFSAGLINFKIMDALVG